MHSHVIYFVEVLTKCEKLFKIIFRKYEIVFQNHEFYSVVWNTLCVTEATDVVVLHAVSCAGPAAGAAHSDEEKDPTRHRAVQGGRQGDSSHTLHAPHATMGMPYRSCSSYHYGYAIPSMLLMPLWVSHTVYAPHATMGKP